MRAPIIWMLRRTRATPTSPSMPASASSARAACAPATSSRERWRSPFRARGFDSRVSASQNVSFMDSECVSCGACVQACPTATLSEKSLIAEGPGGAQRHHHLRLLRSRLLVPRRDAGRGSRAHGAEQGRPRQSRAFLRQGTLRHRLCDASRPHPEADDPREDLRSVARSVAGRRRSATRPRELKRIQSEVRPRLDRRHHLLALHQRGDLPRAETGARRLRQQQRRHLRARVPFARRAMASRTRWANRRARRTSTR